MGPGIIQTRLFLHFLYSSKKVPRYVISTAASKHGKPHDVMGTK
jgi:hypothetical protein